MTESAKPPTPASDTGPLPTDEEAIRAAVAALAARLAPDGAPQEPATQTASVTLAPAAAAATPPAGDAPVTVSPGRALPPAPAEPAASVAPAAPRIDRAPLPGRITSPQVPPRRGPGRLIASLLVLLLLIAGGVWLMRDHPRVAALLDGLRAPAGEPKQATAPPKPAAPVAPRPTVGKPVSPPPGEPTPTATTSAPSPAPSVPPASEPQKVEAPPATPAPPSEPTPATATPTPPSEPAPATATTVPQPAAPAPPSEPAPATATPVPPPAPSVPPTPAPTAASPAPGASPASEPQKVDVPPAPKPPADVASPKQDVAAAPPTFDNVFVRDGRAVVSGRAPSGSRVEVQVDGRTVATVDADPRGEWVAILEAPLPPGGHEVRLVQTPPGGRPVPSDRTVAIVIPPSAGPPPLATAPPVASAPAPAETSKPDAPAQSPPPSAAVPAPRPAATPLVVATPTAPGGASQVLQGPPLARAGDLVLQTVDYDELGRLTVSGQANPGETVRVYLNNAPIGHATAGPDGRWTLAPGRPTPHGPQRLRVDRLTAGGPGVAHRLEVPFERVRVRPGDSVTIVRGDNLWNIARSALGGGERYTAIYEANRNQIRDPNLIYPGQVFVIPKPR